MEHISAFMIVRNEEQMLPRCLRSIEGLVDEVIILDTGSTDGTARFLESMANGDTFARFSWEPHEFRSFGAARQVALDLVQTDWALWMDADEALSPELLAKLIAMSESGEMQRHDGWFLNRSNRVLGRVMTGCNLQGNHVLRLFRTARGRLSETLVHEGIILDPDCTTEVLPEPLYHEAMASWRAYLKKVDQYTSLDVAGSDRRFNPLHMLVTGLLVFLKQYFSRRGFLDGWPGFVWSITSAWSVTLRDYKRLKKALGKEY